MKTKKRENPKTNKTAREIKTEANKHIPESDIQDFLKSKILPEHKSRIKEIKCSNLWANRFRIDVWMEEWEEGSFGPKVWIGYSYFVHYCEGLIIDKTILTSPKKEKIF